MIEDKKSYPPISFRPTGLALRQILAMAKSFEMNVTQVILHCITTVFQDSGLTLKDKEK